MFRWKRPGSAGRGVRPRLSCSFCGRSHAEVEKLVAGAQNAREPDWARLEDETMRHFQAVLRLDTQNPPGNEHAVTDYLKQVLEREGIPVQIFG